MSDDKNRQPKIRRRFMRFSLGTLLLGITVIGVWFGYLTTQANKIRRAVASLEESGADIGYDYQYDGLRENPIAEIPAPKWLRKLIGKEYFIDVVQVSLQGVSGTSNADLEPFRSLNSVHRIDLDYTTIDDISALANLKSLTWLDLEETRIDSDDLVHLKNLNKLRHLILTRTAITDKGTEFINDMTELIDLRLNETGVTDACLVHFEGLVKLRELELADTQVTAYGVARLQIKLPNCEIKWEDRN